MPSLRVTGGAKVSASWPGDSSLPLGRETRERRQQVGAVSQTITIMDLYGLVAATMCHRDTKPNE